MSQEKMQLEKAVEKKIKEIDRIMALEGMTLSQEQMRNLLAYGNSI